MFNDKRIARRRHLPRPDRSAWLELVDAPSSMVSDGLGRRGALDAGLRLVTAAARFTGPALTVQCRPGDNLTALAALESIAPGDVVVLANGGAAGAALIGGNYAAMAKARGAVAIVCDAPARDVDELDALGLPVFARGLMPGGPMKCSPGSIGFDVAVGAVTIATGDVLVGDRDGVVVVPRAALASAVAGYRLVREREAGMVGVIGTGEIPAWLRTLIDGVGIDVVDA